MKNTKVNFLPMRQEHIGQVMEIERQCFSLPWTRGMYEGELTNSLAIYHVAVIEDRVVGYIGMWQVINEAHITTIAVAPEYRRKGIAKSMIRMVIDMIQEHFMLLTLEVRRSNDAAKRLYSSLGFEITGERKRYYEDNDEDADIMTLELFDASIHD